uniref:Polycystin cation channel PKD1/PKD2 domain-containing protein n=1 Tax=Equus asinus TaxID=9793 RepID=A0A9L0J0F9_EQUAS
MWHYQNQETLGGYPIQGEFATYSGGGYVVRLGRNSSTANRVLQHLEQSRWLDRCTRSLFVEFVVFNANVNLFCVVTLILESNNMGAFFTSVRLDTLRSLQTSKKDFAWSVVSQVIYYLLVCYYAFMQFNLLFGWSISDYRTFFSSAVTTVGLLMGISHHKEVIALDPVLGFFLILTSVILMVLVIINLFVSAILMAFGKERRSLKTLKEATLIDMLLQKLSSLLGIQRKQNMSKQP